MFIAESCCPAGLDNGTARLGILQRDCSWKDERSDGESGELIRVFGFAALPAIIMNKAMSLIVVITAIPARLISVPLAELSPYLYIVLNLLAGSLIGAWVGAHWATRLGWKALYRVIAVLLVLIAILLFVTHFFAVEPLNLPLVPGRSSA